MSYLNWFNVGLISISISIYVPTLKELAMRVIFYVCYLTQSEIKTSTHVKRGMSSRFSLK